MAFHWAIVMTAMWILPYEHYHMERMMMWQNIQICQNIFNPHWKNLSSILF
jgi:hypothetical protein